MNTLDLSSLFRHLPHNIIYIKLFSVGCQKPRFLSSSARLFQGHKHYTTYYYFVGKSSVNGKQAQHKMTSHTTQTDKDQLPDLSSTLVVALARSTTFLKNYIRARIFHPSTTGLTLESVFACVTWLASWVANFFFLVGPVLIFVPQYRSIRGTGSAAGFSSTVCLVLLVAHILRIFFWIGKRFELVLLLQSVIVVVFQLALLKICVECDLKEWNRKSEENSLHQKNQVHEKIVEMSTVSITLPKSSSAMKDQEKPFQYPNILRDLATNKFWAWKYYCTYLAVLLIYSLMLTGLCVCVPSLYVLYCSLFVLSGMHRELMCVILLFQVLQSCFCTVLSILRQLDLLDYA